MLREHAGRHRGDPLRRRRREARAAGEAQGPRLASSCRSPNGRCCSTGNYRCVTKDGPRSIKEAVHTDLADVARRLRLGARAVHRARRLAGRPRAVREIRQRRPGARRGRPRRRARFSPARRTSSASTASCRRSRPRRAGATRSSTRPSPSSTTASRQTARRPPDRRRAASPGLASLGSRLAFHGVHPGPGDARTRGFAALQASGKALSRERAPIPSAAFPGACSASGMRPGTQRKTLPRSGAELISQRPSAGEGQGGANRGTERLGQAPPAMA